MLSKLPVQIIILLVIGILVGVINNLVSPNKIPWVQEYVIIDESGEKVEMPKSYDQQSSDSLLTFISTKMAYDIFNRGEAVFVDARTPEDFESGHISGAVNVDFEASDDVFYSQLDNLSAVADPETPVITYCSGTECDLSLGLARYLQSDVGYRNIYVYFGGWDQWIEYNLPIESGTEEAEQMQ
jgi:rhodanese-related sulfurtransferase